ncbi:multicopper oxidase domain-containing protein [Brachybacterium hainanense]|uniref:Multicopper oxidase domain-containing protein n=1 Tax=Brachybacterium hainanense TaxID=1541174 RepID=A0ABV6RFV3_9MICO
MDLPASAPSRSGAMGRRSWHRRASRPVTGWILALLVLSAVHPVVPQWRWLLVHMVTLGLVTTSIMIWGQHFTEALLKTRLGEESRPRQVLRIRLLTGGIVTVCAGMLLDAPWVVVGGTVLVGAMLLWYAQALGAQLRAAIAPRFAVVVRSYLVAACLLPLGAGFGAVLAFSPPEPWHGRLLLAHQLVNVLGFAGITACATLVTLWPTLLRTRIRPGMQRRIGTVMIALLIGVLGASAGALAGWPWLGRGSLLVYAAALGTLLAEFARLARAARPRTALPSPVPRPVFAIASMGSALVWFAISVLGMIALWGGDATTTLTVPLIAGFLIQLLFGAMSYLMPTMLGGGPAALRAALAETSRAAVLRVTIWNVVVAVFTLAPEGSTAARALFAALTLGTTDLEAVGSITRVLVSVLGLGVMIADIVLLGRAVAVGVRARRAAAASSAPVGPAPIPSPTEQTAAVTRRPAELGIPASAAPRTAPGIAPPGLDRRHLTGVLLGLGTMLSVTAAGSAVDRSLSGAPAAGTTAGSGAADVPTTGRTTTIAVSMADMRFTPETLEVPAGDRLVIALTNADDADVHDLVLATGPSSGRLSPGASARVDAGVITSDVDGWCSIVGHRAMGMVLHVRVLGAAGQGGGTEQDGATAQDGAASPADPLSRVTADLQAPPGDGVLVRDAQLPPAPPLDQQITLTVTEPELEVAPGVTMAAMTYGGAVMGPILRSELGGRLRVHLVNDASMGHSLDLHAGQVSPDRAMRTIAPGQSLDYEITTDHAGAWLYHCSTMPMTHHLSAGMFGALIVPPPDLAPVQREYVLVASDIHLEPGDGTAAHAVSGEKIAAGSPDFTVFNGHATQYRHAPLTARAGDRVRIWAVAAGPSRPLSLHVVGAVFDTVFREGEHLLRPDAVTAGGAQALSLSPAQGGFVEMVLPEPGTYTIVDHDMAAMERGAMALLVVAP